LTNIIGEGRVDSKTLKVLELIYRGEDAQVELDEIKEKEIAREQEIQDRAAPHCTSLKSQVDIDGLT